MTKRERELERVHLLMTMVAMERDATAPEICELANAECSCEENDPRLGEIDALPLISAHAITAKLNAMSLAGLVTADQVMAGGPLLWSITDAGRAACQSMQIKREDHMSEPTWSDLSKDQRLNLICEGASASVRAGVFAHFKGREVGDFFDAVNVMLRLSYGEEHGDVKAWDEAAATIGRSVR